MTMRILFVLLLLIITPVDLRPKALVTLKNGLSDGRYSLQLSYQHGGVFATNEFLSGLNAAGVPIDSHQAFSVRVAKQTTGTNLWEQLYAYPRYGIGFFTADFKSEELGQPISVFGFLTGPFFRIRHFSLTYDFAIGLAFHWNKYDPLTNPYNIAIGSAINSMVEAGIGAEVRVFPRVNTGAGFGLTHFSNGGITLPNRGVNNSFWKLSLRYELYSDDPIKPRNRIEKFKDVNEWIIAGYTGFKNAEIPVTVKPMQKQPSVPVYAIGIFGIYHRQLDYKSKIGAGIEFGYNGLVNPQFETVADSLHLIRKPDIRRLEFSIFPSYELTFNKLSLFVEAGFYLYRNELIKISPVFYQRVGIKYYFTDHIFAAIQIRARSVAKAVMIEWTMGYRF
ncbi:MAG: acyloxyacyl hydrolase [Bacteroidales bacterium]